MEPSTQEQPPSTYLTAANSFQEMQYIDSLFAKSSSPNSFNANQQQIVKGHDQSSALRARVASAPNNIMHQNTHMVDNTMQNQAAMADQKGSITLDPNSLFLEDDKITNSSTDSLLNFLTMPLNNQLLSNEQFEFGSATYGFGNIFDPLSSGHKFLSKTNEFESLDDCFTQSNINPSMAQSMSFSVPATPTKSMFGNVHQHHPKSVSKPPNFNTFRQTPQGLPATQFNSANNLFESLNVDKSNPPSLDKAKIVHEDSDEEGGGSKQSKRKKKKKNMFSVEHQIILMNYFNDVSNTPTRSQRMELIQRVGTTEKTIRIWFQNQRQKLVRIARLQGHQIGEGDQHHLKIPCIPSQIYKTSSKKEKTKNMFTQPNQSFSLNRDHVPPQSIEVQQINTAYSSQGTITPITPSHIYSQQLSIPPNHLSLDNHNNSASTMANAMNSYAGYQNNSNSLKSVPGSSEMVLVNGIYPSPEVNSIPQSSVTPCMNVLSLGGSNTPSNALLHPNMNADPTSNVLGLFSPQGLGISTGSTAPQTLFSSQHPLTPFLNVYGDQLSNSSTHVSNNNHVLALNTHNLDFNLLNAGPQIPQSASSSSFLGFSLSPSIRSNNLSLSCPESPLNLNQFPLTPLDDNFFMANCLNPAQDSSSNIGQQ